MDTPAAPLPDLVLWRGDRCHMCDDARDLVTLLLAERAAAGARAPALVERRIADDPAAERELFEQIPVLEIDGRRLVLAVRVGPVRAFLAAALDDREDAEEGANAGPGGNSDRSAAAVGSPLGAGAPVNARGD